MFPKKKKSTVLLVPRRAGQSVAEQWEKLLDERLLPIVFGPMMFWVLALVAWAQSRLSKPLPVTFWLGCAIISTGAAAISLLRLIPRARALVRGERGERAVAEQLEELRAQGFRCFHDLVRDGFNIDHVVVGPPGVFVIETKFRGGSGLIEFRNGQGIFVDGREEERDPLTQARGNAREVNQLISRDAGLDVWVKPMVVFVGDWKVKNAWQNPGARVLTARQIGRYFSKQDQPELTRSEIQLICSHLMRSARAS